LSWVPPALHPFITLYDHSSFSFFNILVFEDQGKVIEKGSHDQLMGTVDGEYRNLVEKQLEKKFKL